MCLCSSTKQCDKHHFPVLPGKIQSLRPRSDFTFLVKSLLDTLGWVHSSESTAFLVPFTPHYGKCDAQVSYSKGSGPRSVLHVSSYLDDNFLENQHVGWLFLSFPLELCQHPNKSLGSLVARWSHHCGVTRPRVPWAALSW